MDKLRIDKWLWAARFFKTRSLAADEVHRDRVLVNGQVPKPSREVKPGDRIGLRQQGPERVVVVVGLSKQRGPAPVAQQLYAETPESLAAQQAWREQNRWSPEPAHSLTQGRPTKRDRRDIDRQRHDWGDRWSAALD
ncbi:MAG: RNA-binding S4 domain-containing protein [Alphaproteobacteria bacterium]|nr:RNA-binding S4 domain-containing protein [Alphaproteobacteria bacterium]